ncbi:MAG: hypothetical protein Q8904_14595 [Bacteroidota bacterium]|nr:hypothetical protein [Bacteroidota bacterium]
MKNIILITFLLILCTVNCKAGSQQKDSNKSAYWEDLTKIEQESILHSPQIDKNAIKYYHGSFKATDNQSTESLLNKIISEKNPTKETVFYFHILNQICLKSDGALSEILGKYCMKFLLRNPVLVLRYFQQNKKVEKIYGEFIGSELYFKEEGTSDIEYNYKDFKRIVEAKTNGNKEFKKTLVEFYGIIESAMKNMN